MKNNIFYILAFALAGVVTVFDFLVEVAPEWQAPLVAFTWWVTFWGVLAYLFIEKIKMYRTKFEKGTLISILVGVIIFKLLIFILALCFHHDNAEKWHAFVNNHTYDTYGLLFFVILLTVNLWVLRSKFGRYVSLLFSLLRGLFSSTIKSESK